MPYQSDENLLKKYQKNMKKFKNVAEKKTIKRGRKNPKKVTITKIYIYIYSKKWEIEKNCLLLVVRIGIQHFSSFSILKKTKTVQNELEALAKS